MINPFHEINWKPGEKEIGKFGTSMLIGFPLIALLFFVINICRLPLAGAWQLPAILAGTGVFLCLLAKTLPAAAKPVYLVWFFAAACIGALVSNILLIIFYYAVFSPFALGIRILTGRDPLRLKKPERLLSYWTERNTKRSVKSYLQQY